MMNDAGYEVIDGEVFEPTGDPKSKISVLKRGNGRKVQVPKPGSEASDQRADPDDGEPSGAAPRTSFERELHPLLKARAEEFTRRHEAMSRAYEQALFGSMSDALEAAHRPPVVEPPKTPLVARLVSSCGEALVQVGQRLVSATEPDAPAQEAPEPPWVMDRPTVIVFAEDGGMDD